MNAVDEGKPPDAALIQISERAIAFVARSGLRLRGATPGFAHCMMPLAGNENHLGTMYAGAQFTLADITGGVLALASFDRAYFYPILKNLQLEFLKPATTDLSLIYRITADELLTLQQIAETHGKAGFPLHGELLDKNGVVVTRASGEFQVRAKP